MLRVGITGGIGSGKSLVCKIFAFLKIPVYDSDSRARLLYTSSTELKLAVLKHFGTESYFENGQLNSKHLARAIYTDNSKKELLNQLVHPLVGADFKHWVSVQSAPYILKEAAIMFESDSAQQLDKIIVITSPLEVRIDRIRKRDNWRSESEIEAIIANQWPEKELIKRADFVVANDELKPLLPQVLNLNKQLLELSKLKK